MFKLNQKQVFQRVKKITFKLRKKKFKTIRKITTKCEFKTLFKI